MMCERIEGSKLRERERETVYVRVDAIQRALCGGEALPYLGASVSWCGLTLE